MAATRARIDDQAILRRINLRGHELLLVTVQFFLAQCERLLLGFHVRLDLGQLAVILEFHAVEIFLGFLQRRLEGRAERLLQF